ncbi:MAG TPA: O-antigen ligase family protein [Verrucomicrobiae bacterium]|nr:O-antigen ligase family protein [Verrucomicrobiae bacterium]
MAPSHNPGKIDDAVVLRLFLALFGVVLGLALLKFPNPPVLEQLVTTPTGFWEWILTAWPARYGRGLLCVIGLIGIFLVRRPARLPLPLLLLPLAWLVWVTLSVVWTLNAKVSNPTWLHLVACVGCFYAGLLVLGRVSKPWPFFLGLIGAFVVVLAAGWQQRWGGLQESRVYFFTYIYPTLKEVSPDLLKKMNSDRIFATLFYPNSLAGALLLLTPVVLGAIAVAKNRITAGARWFLAGVVGLGALGCLVWSGSKGGWLIALFLSVIAMFRLPTSRRIKIMIASGFLVLGLTGFLARYLGFFQRGATSVVARADYARAAWLNIRDHPLLGSGPGTFATVYEAVKPPDAEMTRLVHNDYLQQASDSGILAGLLFTALVVGVLFKTRTAWASRDWLVFGTWLGLLGFAVQATLEFGFYIPATAWCWFALAGWLLAQAGLRFDNPNADT